MERLQRDTLFHTPREGVKSSFAFDHDVAAVFDDMISRSVPLYPEIQRATALLAARVVPAGSTVVDLGCSTGTTLAVLAQALAGRDVKLVGVDNSQPMLDACGEKLRAMQIQDIELVLDDVRQFQLPPCALAVLNYTLQFVAPEERQGLLERIAAALPDKGVLLLSEKIRHRDATINELWIELHHDFKRQHGYSELEIQQKRDAIEDVLIPLTLDENFAMLRAAGFRSAEVLATSLNFVTIVAVR